MIPHPLPISLQTLLGSDLSAECVHAHASHAHVCKAASDGWCYYPRLLRGGKVLKRTKTLGCLCFIIKNYHSEVKMHVHVHVCAHVGEMISHL